jgi:peptidoglycan-associated lipoprotein
MKIKLVYSMMLALAVALASTGCKHKPERVTPIGEPQGAQVGGNGPGNTIPYDPNAGGPGTTIAEKEFNIDNFTPDRDALASDTIHFSYDSAVIKDSEKTKIQAVAAALQSNHGVQLQIEGHCDERGTEEYNRALGERRAEAAREALVAAGVDANRIHTISFGKDKPVETGHDEASWSKNRRDEFILLHPKMGM